MARSANGIGNIYYHFGQLQEAWQHLVVSQELARYVGDGLLASKCDLRLGLIEWRSGQLEEARVRLEHCRQVLHQFGDRKAEAYVMINLGIVYGELGQMQDKLSCYLQAQEICETMGDIASLRIIYHNLGNFYQAQEKHDDAIQYYQMQLALDPDNQRAPLRCRGHAGLAESFLTLKDRRQALHHVDAAQELAQTSEQPRDLGISLRVRGEVMQFQNKHTEAKTLFEQSLAILTDQQDPQEIAKVQAALARLSDSAVGS